MNGSRTIDCTPPVMAGLVPTVLAPRSGVRLRTLRDRRGVEARHKAGQDGRFFGLRRDSKGNAA